VTRRPRSGGGLLVTSLFLAGPPDTTPPSSILGTTPATQTGGATPITPPTSAAFSIRSEKVDEQQGSQAGAIGPAGATFAIKQCGYAGRRTTVLHQNFPSML